MPQISWVSVWRIFQRKDREYTFSSQHHMESSLKSITLQVKKVLKIKNKIYHIITAYSRLTPEHNNKQITEPTHKYVKRTEHSLNEC